MRLFPWSKKVSFEEDFHAWLSFFIVKIWWLLILMLIFNQTKKINKCFDSLEFEYVYNLDILKYFYFHKNIKKVNFKLRKIWIIRCKRANVILLSCKNFVIIRHYYIKFSCNFEETNDTRVFRWKTLPSGENLSDHSSRRHEPRNR